MSSFEDKRDELLTWNELYMTLNVKTFPVYPSTYVTEVLDILRKLNPCEALKDEYLDAVAEAYELRSLKNGLDALGTAMQEFGLRLCYKKSPDNTYYTVWMHEVENTQKYLNLFKPYLTRRCFFNNINTFALTDGERIDDPSDDVDMECFDISIQLTMPRCGAPEPFLLRGNQTYLCVPYRECKDNNEFFNAIHLKTMTVCNNLEYTYDKNCILPHIIHGSEVFMSDEPKHWVLCKQKSNRWVPDYDAYDEGKEYEENNNPIKSMYLTSPGKESDIITHQEMIPVAEQENMTVYMLNSGLRTGRLFVTHTKANRFFVKASLTDVDCKKQPVVKHMWQDGHPYLFVGFTPSLWYVFDLEAMTYSKHKDACDLSGQFKCTEDRVYLCMDDGRVLRMKNFSALKLSEPTDFSAEFLKEIKPCKTEHKGEPNKTPFYALRRNRKNPQTEQSFEFGEPGVTLHVIFE